MILDVISAYAPQVGYEMEEKENFWNDFPKEERLVTEAYFSGLAKRCRGGGQIWCRKTEY